MRYRVRRGRREGGTMRRKGRGGEKRKTLKLKNGRRNGRGGERRGGDEEGYKREKRKE